MREGIKVFCITALFTLCFLLGILAAVSAFGFQPEYGPGSTQYTHMDISKEKFGRGAKAYYIFEPIEPTIESAPLIIFMHGLFGTAPTLYMGWIEHIVKKGNIVVFPEYQSIFSGISCDKFMENSIYAIKDSLSNMKTVPQLNRVAIVGHSAGALLAANLAAVATEVDIPNFRAVMCVAPGITPFFDLEDMTRIPEYTLLITVSGDKDVMVGNKDAKKIYNETTQILNKNYIEIQSDKGNTANHFAALSGTWMGNNIDGYCYWKIFEALCDAAFYNVNWEYCLGDTPEQRYMGVIETWFGMEKPMKELLITVPGED